MERETLERVDDVDERGDEWGDELAARCAQNNAAANREAAIGARARGLTFDT